MYALNSGCAAALVIARRGQGRVEKVPKSLRSYFRKPEDMLRSGAWSKVAKKSNTVGGFNRNKFYFSGSHKKVPTNRRMHGKLRQTSTSGPGRYGIVQVLMAPHIRQKQGAIGFPVLKQINA